MGILDILLISIGFSMDNMAVAAASACANTDYSFKTNLKVAVSFCLTGIICLLLGFFMGKKMGAFFGKKAEFIGGIILIIIAVKILIQGIIDV